MFFHFVVDHISVVFGEAIPGHVSGMAGDASDASALEHGSGAGSGGGEVVEAEPFALAVFAAAVGADHHGVGGRSFEVGEGVGDGAVFDGGIIIFWININTCGYIDEVVHVTVDTELPCGFLTVFGPGEFYLVRGGSTNIGVGGSRAGHIGGEVDFVAPAAKVACVTDGTHLHGVVGFGDEVFKGVDISGEIVDGDIDKVVHVVVHADLPVFGSAVLGPAQVNATSTGSLIIEVGGFGTRLCADGVDYGTVTVAVATAGKKRITSFGEGERTFIVVIAAIPNERNIIRTTVYRATSRRTR